MEITRVPKSQTEGQGCQEAHGRKMCGGYVIAFRIVLMTQMKVMVRIPPLVGHLSKFKKNVSKLITIQRQPTQHYVTLKLIGCLHYLDLCFGDRTDDTLFSCGIPKSTPHHPGTVYMSTKRKCDDVRNCLDGEDEKHCSGKLKK